MTDTSDSTTQFARELWRRLESLHAVTYFAPDSVEQAREIGLNGFWRMYFAFRAAPLGACSAGAVTAAFFGFAPAMVARAIPAVWDMASPTEIVRVRAASVAAALRRVAGDELEVLVDDRWAMDTLRGAIDRAGDGSLPLFLANRDLDQSDDPVAALWQHATCLREHRGDGHVATWTSMGFSPAEVAALFVAGGGTRRDALQPHRGWTDDDWQLAIDRVTGHGLLDDGELTEAGAAVVAHVELTTDQLAAAPFEALDPDARGRLLDALTPAAIAVGRSGLIPSVNPMGVPLLDGDDDGGRS